MVKPARRIGILTGGGDCPGLNSVIRAVVRKADREGYLITGIRNGWLGLIANDWVSLNLDAVSGILPKGGTILGTSRTNPYQEPKTAKKVIQNYHHLHLEALIAVGGDDTLGVANKLCQEGLHIVGIPKTIDNDLSSTDYTFGFDTAVNIATEAIDRLHTTAESHHRIMVVEVMGRHAGWIAVHAGIAGGADMILVPEIPVDIDEVCRVIKQRHRRGKSFSIIVIAEGATLEGVGMSVQEERRDAFGHVRLGGIGQLLADQIERRTGFETRVTVLGHLQRGGSPTAFDRVLGTRFGVKAVELVIQKRFSRMVSLQGNHIVDVSLERAVGKLKTVDMGLYEIGKVFFG